MGTFVSIRWSPARRRDSILGGGVRVNEDGDEEGIEYGIARSTARSVDHSLARTYGKDVVANVQRFKIVALIQRQ
jgi:hypothetical protein